MASPKKRGLGRGIDALIGMQQAPLDGSPSNDPNAESLTHLELDQLQRGRYQPREDIDEGALKELADSIKSQGVVQPIVVRPLSGAGVRYEIVAGERRWRASQLAGLSTIPAIVRDISDRTAMSIALIENIQRQQLNPIEEARALSRLINEFEMTHKEVSEAVGRSRSSVSNLLRLLELEEETKRLLEAGRLEMGHARALAGLPVKDQVRLAAQVASEGLSVRETERLVKSARQVRKPPPIATLDSDPNINALESDLSEKLGARVAIRHKPSGAGSIVVNYNSLDELDGILKHLK